MPAKRSADGIVTQQHRTIFGGVSRQPHEVRRENQVQEADNALMSIATGGFEKRPSSQHIARLPGLDTTTDYAVHSIDRDATEQFVVLLGDQNVLIYDAIAGTRRTLTIGDSTRFFLVDQAGIDSTGVVQIAAANMSVQAAFGPDETAFAWSYTMTDALTVFKIEGSVDGTTWNDIATGKTGASGSFSTTIDAVATGDHNFIRVNITTAAGAGTDTITLSAVFQDKTYLLGANPEDYAFVTVADFTFIANRTVKVQTGVVDTGTLTGTVQEFGDLPTTGVTAAEIYKILGDDIGGFGSFFVVAGGNSPDENWVETVDPTAVNSFRADTMPHQLVRNADGTWTFQAATWSGRTVGDAVTIPDPAFVLREIADIFFHRNRMGLLADESVMFSRAGEFLNYYGEKATQSLATDPIDRAASTTAVTLLKWATPFRKLLFVTAEKAQFEVSAVANLTPDATVIDLATAYRASVLAKPKVMGDTLYFASHVPDAAVLYEYFFEDDSLSNTAEPVTKHVVDYIPRDIWSIATDSETGTVFALSTGESNAVFVYKVFWDGVDKVMSSWAKWEFGATEADAFIHGITTLSGFLVIVIERSDGIHLEQIQIEREAIDADLGFVPLLDVRALPTGIYEASPDKTYWTLPYLHGSAVRLLLGGDFSEPGRELSVAYTAVPTNLVSQPEDFTHANWTATALTVTANQIEGPDAGKTAEKLLETAATSVHTIANTFSATASTSYVFSAFVKATGRTFVYLETDATGATKRAWFNLTTGATGTIESGLTASIISYGDSWYRVTIKMTADATASKAVKLGLADADNSSSYLGVVTKGIYAVGAQVAAAAFVPPYYADTIEHADQFDDGPCYVGKDYTMTTELSKLYIRDQIGAAKFSARVQLKRLYFAFQKTGYFKVTVTPDSGRSAESYEMTGRILGDAGNKIGTPAIIENGVFRVPASGDSQKTKIEIINDSPYPSVITSLIWKGHAVDIEE